MKKTPLRSLWWIIDLQLKESKRYLLWLVFNSVYSGVSSVASIYVGAKFLTSVAAVVTNKNVASQVYWWLCLLLAIQLVTIVVQTLNMIIERRLQQKMDVTLNAILITKMYELSQEQFDDEGFNTKLARARDSLSSIWRIISVFSRTISALITFMSSIVAIFAVAPIVGIVVTVMAIPVSLLRVRQNKNYEEVNNKVEPLDRVAYRTRWMLIDPNVMPEIRLMNGFKHLLETWRTNMVKSQNIIHQADKKMIPVDAGAEIIEPLVSFGGVLYFLHLLISGVIGLDRFIFLRGLLDQAGNAASMTVSSLKELHELSIDLQNFQDVYNTKPSIPNGTVQIERPLTIEFKKVTFKYPRTEHLILDDISLLIMPGSKLALVGENGAGKSTLIKLLLRQYLPSSGQILVNGTDIKDVEQKSYYEAISNLSQDFLIVNHLTIKDNMTIGLDNEVSDKEMHDIATLVGADKFIEKLPHKYLQRLDPSFDDGTGLSGGQLQRLGVARSLLRHGDMLILDEPTSAVDAKAEYTIFNNIYEKHGDKTTLIVSHRFSTVRKADRIIVLENGKIIEYGSHEELISYGGLYKEMFETQAEGYK